MGRGEALGLCQNQNSLLVKVKCQNDNRVGRQGTLLCKEINIGYL